ncbi:YqgE/AlgH family protein [Usitatibacter palustris]|uniref:Uncharacterized protein n=1 Tax=Usitatibacter palustris TaxID=2732487 RepID=A0A6M4H9D0_9PROT|nr:YqgE/AlgH family protein [Usitatibacter palustris]QJR15872.1 hypothetical protein DSM104440_02698 [Usitatibacter palustris]
MRTTLFLLVLLGLPVAAASAPPPKDIPAVLLIAKGDMVDPYFRQAVVLVTHRAGSTPMGVIINKATKVPLAEAVPRLENRPAPERRVFFGGPVPADELIVLFRSAKAPEGSIQALDGVVISSDQDVLRAAVNRERAVDVRVLLGYASWAPGQLEAEVARGDWQLLPADAATIFDSNPETMWRDLQQQLAPKNAAAPGQPSATRPLRVAKQRAFAVATKSRT